MTTITCVRKPNFNGNVTPVPDTRALGQAQGAPHRALAITRHTAHLKALGSPAVPNKGPGGFGAGPRGVEAEHVRAVSPHPLRISGGGCNGVRVAATAFGSSSLRLWRSNMPGCCRRSAGAVLFFQIQFRHELANLASQRGDWILSATTGCGWRDTASASPIPPSMDAVSHTLARSQF